MAESRVMPRLRVLLMTVLAMSLAGCGDNLGDLQQYVNEVKARKPGRIEPLPEIIPHETFTYQAQNLRDPFTELDFGEAEPVTTVDSGIRPNANRPREPLESFPLDSVRMVGTLERDDQLWGLIKAGDGTIHRVLPGNYVGQNHGKIIQIAANQIDIIEIVPDGLGGWMQRPASLALSE